MIPSSQRHFLINLVHAFDSMIVPSGRPDGDDDEEKDDTDKGEQDDGNDTDTGGEGSEGEVKNPELKKLHDENARHRNAAKAEKDRADKAEKRLRELDDANKSELEKAQRDAKESRERADKAEELNKKQAVKLAFFESGASAQFRNPATALRLLDLSEVTLDDDGIADTDEVKKLADALAKAEPYLLKDGSEDDVTGSDDTKPPSGRQTNKKKSKDDLNKEALVKKFPALQNR